MTAPSERKAIYRAHGAWGKDGRFGLRAEGEIYGKTGMLESPLVVSPDLGGPPLAAGQATGTNPEELLVAAATSCLLITLGMALERLRIPATALRAEGVGTVAPGAGGIFAFSEIAVTLEVTLGAAPAGEPGEEQLRAALRVAEERCLIAKAVHGNVRYVSRLIATSGDGTQREVSLES